MSHLCSTHAIATGNIRIREVTLASIAAKSQTNVNKANGNNNNNGKVSSNDGNNTKQQFRLVIVHYPSYNDNDDIISTMIRGIKSIINHAKGTNIQTMIAANYSPLTYQLITL